MRCRKGRNSISSADQQVSKWDEVGTVVAYSPKNEKHGCLNSSRHTLAVEIKSKIRFFSLHRKLTPLAKTYGD